jgi:hypothetical protein
VREPGLAFFSCKHIILNVYGRPWHLRREFLCQH